jgi:hypothetical protein
MCPIAESFGYAVVGYVAVRRHSLPTPPPPPTGIVDIPVKHIAINNVDFPQPLAAHGKRTRAPCAWLLGYGGGFGLVGGVSGIFAHSGYRRVKR